MIKMLRPNFRWNLVLRRKAGGRVMANFHPVLLMQIVYCYTIDRNPLAGNPT